METLWVSMPLAVTICGNLADACLPVGRAVSSVVWRTDFSLSDQID